MSSLKKCFVYCFLFFFLLCPSVVAQSDEGEFSKAGEVTFGNVALSTGVTLQYAEQGRGKSNVLIMLHGYLDSWFSFSEVMANLPGNIHAIAITQRGHGDSSKPEDGYAMTDFSEDVIAFMDHFGYRKASIIGHSMGSIIAQRVAIDHPDRVKKLILMGSGVNMTQNEVLLYVDDLLVGLDDPIDHDFVYEFQSGTARDPISSEFIDTIVTETEKVPARVWRDALTGLLAADHTAEIGLIQAHTLVIWGSEDGIFPIADQEALLVGLPDLTMQVYPNLSHSPNWQRPRLVAFEIVNFLRQINAKCPGSLIP